MTPAKSPGSLPLRIHTSALERASTYHAEKSRPTEYTSSELSSIIAGLHLHASGSIVTLPVEILALIFEIGYHQYTDRISARMFVLKVSHVSRQWWNVATSHQILWTDIIIFLQSNPLLPLKQSLERSGTLPIDINITSTQDLDRAILKYLTQSVFKVIAGYSSRWRTFRAECLTHANAGDVREGLKTIKAPILEEFKLATQGATHHHEATYLSSGRWSAAPNINDGSIHNVFSGGAVSLRSVTVRHVLCLPPMQAVRVLHLNTIFNASSYPHDPTVAAILNNLPLLEKLTIRGSVASTGYLAVFTPSKVSLPSLISLRILASEDGRVPQFEFLDAISAPLLESVALEHGCYSSVRLLANKFPQVRTLAFAPAEILLEAPEQDPQAMMVHLNVVFKNLTHLIVKSTAQPYTYLQPLEMHVWPAMEDLSISQLPDSGVMPFCDSLLRRSQVCPMPRRLLLRGCDEAVVAAVAIGLATRGIDIEVDSSIGDDVLWYEDREVSRTWCAVQLYLWILLMR